MSDTAAPIGLWNIARETPDKTALVDPDGVEHSYGEIVSRANRVSNGLRRHGFVTGDTLVIATPNCVETVVLQFAALQIGLYLAPVNWHLTGPEIAYILGDSEAKIFIAHETVRRDRADRRPRGRVRVGESVRRRRRRGVPAARRAVRRRRRQSAVGPDDRRADAVHLGHHGQAGRVCAAR